MHKVTVDGRVLFAAHGEHLSEVLQTGGIPLAHPCGGRGTCQKCTVWVDGEPQLSCRYVVTRDIAVSYTPPVWAPTDTAPVTPVTHSVLVLDLGSTTLALALVDRDTQGTVAVRTAGNPQCAFGADVISRIAYCGEAGGLSRLQRAVVEEINRLIASFTLPAPVETLFVAGNTTMLHLLFGVDPTPMGVAPYTPAFLEKRTALAVDLGLTGVTQVVAMPGIAAFVGADLVAGLNAVALPPEGKYALLVDLGTNAEILLFDRHHLLCTAAAAGPCFEGANISCGMSATSGALCTYTAEGSYTTIDDQPPCGLCGSGLMDAVAVLLADGRVDETGYMEEESILLAEGVALTQGDIRQYQLAKSAVCSGISALLNRAGVVAADVHRLYLSGGFSTKINLDNAVATGLLPRELLPCCETVGNSALAGAVEYALIGALSPTLTDAVYVDLAADDVFSQLFMENMLFS